MGMRIFLEIGLDWWNQLDSVRQITLNAQGSLAQRIAPMGAGWQASARSGIAISMRRAMMTYAQERTVN